MTHTLFLITAYFFVGSIVMLLVNELVEGACTEKEFVRGMFLWPLVVTYCMGYGLLSYVRRALRRG
jgi:hypothetical protein